MLNNFLGIFVLHWFILIYFWTISPHIISYISLFELFYFIFNIFPEVLSLPLSSITSVIVLFFLQRLSTNQKPCWNHSLSVSDYSVSITYLCLLKCVDIHCLIVIIPSVSVCCCYVSVPASLSIASSPHLHTLDISPHFCPCSLHVTVNLCDVSDILFSA